MRILFFTSCFISSLTIFQLSTFQSLALSDKWSVSSRPAESTCIEGITGFLEKIAISSNINAILNPSVSDCNQAIKLLTQYERLAQKLGVNLTPKRIQELNQKRDAGTIKSSDLPGTIQRQFPGIFAGKTLSEIRQICNRPIPATLPL
jgi:hypothetical protein